MTDEAIQETAQAFYDILSDIHSELSRLVYLYEVDLRAKGVLG